MYDAIISQTLVEYRVLRLPHVDHQLKYQQHALFIKLETMLNGIDNRPLEIIGSAPLFFLLPLFWKARSIATEIVYRQKEARPGYVISSFINEGVIRPMGVIADLLSMRISPVESAPPVGIKTVQKDDMDEKVMSVDLAMMWSASQGKTGSEKMREMLSKIASSIQGVSRVHLQGEAPEVPVLACVNLLVELGKKVEFENIDFEQL